MRNEEMPSLVELLSLDKSAFRKKFHGSPILRAKRVGLLRSAAIALGNHPLESCDISAGLHSLCRALRDEEPVLRGAAAWALGQWRQRIPTIAPQILDALQAQLVDEQDDIAQCEIRSAIGQSK
jgi:epoxyqueuosine reductase